MMYAHSDAASNWRKLIGRVAPYLWPRDSRILRIRVVAALIVLIAAKLVNILIPFALKSVVDGLDTRGVMAIPLAAILAYGAARLGSALFANLRDAIFARVGYHAGRLISLRTYQHLFKLSLGYHLARRTGELARAIERGVKAVSFLLRIAVFNLVPTLFEFMLVIGILLIQYPPIFALITFVTILTYAVFTIWTTEWRTKFRRAMNEEDNRIGAQSVDGLINYETVKSFSNEDLEARRLDASLARYEIAADRSEFSLAALNAGQAAIVALGMTVIMIEAARQVVAGHMTVGDVVLVNTFLIQLYQPLSFLGRAYREIKQSMVDLENIDGILMLRPQIQDVADAKPYRPKGGGVRFDRVSFAYDVRRPILDELSFEIPPGQKVAVVGPSGTGKSTIVRLLFRFYDVSTGRVSVDGYDVRRLQQHSLREAIGVVPQDTVLFNDTIEANIAYARPTASRQEVIEAARIAQIHDFVEALPDGYDTIVGERGLKLSGGEKQRAAIARVMLKNPAILVLDEATSALDTHTEQALQGALHNAAMGRTTLIIAHRLSTIIDADEIIVLDQGRVAERGTHATLLSFGGLYAQMWRRQQQSPSVIDPLPLPAT